MTTPALRLRDLERRHRSGLGIGREPRRGVGPIDLDVAPGEPLAILGPSGCGKSTLLAVIAGLDRPDRGTIEVDGVRVERRDPGRRDIGLVEQHLPLYEHLDGRGNVEMAISGLRLERPEVGSRTTSALEIADAVDLADRRAATLSGGERARICLARVLARRPTIALLDEPFNGLDPDRRRRLADLTLRTLGDAGVAVLLVTHDDRDLEGIDRRLVLDENGHLA